ncbi:MAG: ABC transporter permease [Acidimicrobiales bacterium]
MRWSDVIALSYRNVIRRPGRAVLTVSAVGLAAALFTALLTISGRARTEVLDQLTHGGPLAGINVAAAAPNQIEADVDNPQPGASRVLDDAALGRIAAVDGVRSVTPIVSAQVIAVPGDPILLADGRTIAMRVEDGPRGALFETVLGIDLDHVHELPISLLAGRFPAVGARTEVAATVGWLARLGLDRADAPSIVGTTISIGATRAFRDGFRTRWTKVHVVGVVAQQASSAGGLIESIDQVRDALNWTAASVDNNRFEVPKSPYSGAFVVATDLDRVAAVRNDISGIGYSTSAPENLIANVRRYLHVVRVVLAGIGLISLAIAALGVSNALLAAVRERQREIGVIKAIGARDRDVVRIFLVEAGVLGTIGGVLGVTLGVGIAGVVAIIVNSYLHSQGLAGVRVGLPIDVVVGGITGAGVLSMVAAVVPALRASRLPARQAVDA